MGYIFAIGVAVMWGVLLHGKFFAADYLCLAVIGFIIFVWIRSYLNEQKYILNRKEHDRKRVSDIANAFFALNAQFLSDSSKSVLGFESEIDAELKAAKIGGQYFKLQGKYVVVNRRLVEHEVALCSSFLSEALMLPPTELSVALPALSLKSIPESEDARSVSQARVVKLLSEREKIKTAALANIETRTNADFSDDATAVYVFASRVGCKVGISDAPEKRLRQIQTGHPVKLKIVKVWWFANSTDAGRVEKQAHGLLKVLGVHASGEWFSAPSKMVIEQVRKVIAELVSTSEIDRSLKRLGADDSSEIDSTLAKLVGVPWKISQKGNDWLQIGADHIVVFKWRRGLYKFRYKDKFSDESFKTKADAKAAALHIVLLENKSRI